MDTSRSDNDSRERPSQKSKSSREKSYENKNYDFAFNIFNKYDFALNLLRSINPGRYMFVKCYENRISKVHQQCTEVRFTSFLSGGFITAIIVDPLAKSTSVQCSVKQTKSFKNTSAPLCG